ncbi:Rrp9p/U3-55K-family snoRNP-associated protein [Cryptosporidium ryanae]|uniref:Rrp9p/U3-55K-family snoRNP-associated protein n=1 Tax=Cryptosporidium ryanae TaxID=515981 RepID=UPI00351A4F45|nr:Rrp9p/U3-55K-family snoRNP-associated protein [Cryptosporidium ryanae]
MKRRHNGRDISNDEICSSEEEAAEFFGDRNEDSGTGSELDNDDFFQNVDERKISLAKKYLRKIDGLDDEKRKERLTTLEGKVLEKKIAGNINILGSKSTFYKGHKLSPTCITLDRNNGNFVYTGSKDCSIVKWDIETGKKTVFPGSRKDFSCGGHFEQVKSICYHKETNLICSAGEDRVIRIWDHRVRKCIDKLHGHSDTITGVICEPNSDMEQIISVSYDKTVKVWSLTTRTHMNTYYGHTNKITCCDIAIKDRPFTGSEDNTCRLWKLSSDSHLIFYSSNSGVNKSTIESPIDSVSCLNNINYITGQQNGILNIWSQLKKKPLLTVGDLHSSGINSIKSIPFSDLFFTGGSDQYIKAWKFFNNKLTLVDEVFIKGFVNDMFISDKFLVAAIGQEHRLGRWDTIKQSKNGIFIVPLEY